MKVCEICNGRVIEDLVDFESTILGENVVIQKIDGFRCLECGFTKVDNAIMEGLKIRLLKEKFPIQKRKLKNYNPLLINNIRKIREEKKISQKEIGEALGYTEQRFGAIERNDNTPLISTALLIADSLEVDVSELYKEIYVSNDFYDIIKNLSIKNDLKLSSDNLNDIEFVEIKRLVEINNKYSILDKEINSKMAALRKMKKEDKYFQDIKKTEKEIRVLKKNKAWSKNEEIKESISKKEIRITKFHEQETVLEIYELENEIKELKRAKNEVLKERRTVENESNCILKQSQSIDGEIFDLLKDKYKDKYSTMY